MSKYIFFKNKTISFNVEESRKNYSSKEEFAKAFPTVGKGIINEAWAKIKPAKAEKPAEAEEAAEPKEPKAEKSEKAKK